MRRLISSRECSPLPRRSVSSHWLCISLDSTSSVQYGAGFIVDEVQTGGGATGTMW